MRMVRWMYNVKVKDRVPSKELRERLGNNLCTTAKQAAMVWAPIATWVKKKNVWRWRAPNQEVDQRALGAKFCKKIVKHIN